VSVEATHAPPGRLVTGPSALGGDLRRVLQLAVTLAVMDFKLRFFGSTLGYLWQLMRPLMLFGVLYVVFTEFVRLGADIRFYPAILLMGIVVYTFFSDSTGGAVTSVTDRENLIRKIEFPRLVVPASVVLTAYFNLMLNLIAVLVFVFITGVEPRLEWITLPVFLLGLGTFAGGLAMLLSALYVRFRDVKPIWEVLLQVIFYGSPILYVLEKIPNVDFQELIVMLNPLATVLVQMRHSLIDPNAPNAWETVSSPEMLAVPALIVVVVCAVGLFVFNREAPRIAEEL
jgi:ABC-2 type transport system permease protein